MKKLLAGLILALSVSSANALAPGFCAYNSTVQTGWQSGIYKQTLFDTIKRDSSNRYAIVNSTWEPIFATEAEQWVNINGQIQINGLAANTPEVVVAKVVKNNQLDVQTGEIIITTNLYNAVVVQFNAQDVAQPGDYYWIILNIATATGAQIDNNPAHTFMCGIVVM